MIASRNETQIGQNYPWVGGGSIYHYLGPLGPDFLLSRLESARTDESVWSDSWAQPWEFLVRNSLPPPPHPPAPIPPPPTHLDPSLFARLYQFSSPICLRALQTVARVRNKKCTMLYSTQGQYKCLFLVFYLNLLVEVLNFVVKSIFFAEFIRS